MQWFNSIFITCALSILVSAVPTPETAENRAPTRIFPSLIIPANQSEPDNAFGTQYKGDVSYVSASARNEIVLYVAFDVPPRGGLNCFINFRLPTRASDPNGYKWKVTGTGRLSVYGLDSDIDENALCWNDRPGRSPSAPLFRITQPTSGGDATVTGAGIECRRGERMGFEVSVTRPGASTFNWYELRSPLSGITLEMRD